MAMILSCSLVHESSVVDLCATEGPGGEGRGMASLGGVPLHAHLCCPLAVLLLGYRLRAHRTNEMCTPRLRCTPAQVRQMKTPCTRGGGARGRGATARKASAASSAELLQNRQLRCMPKASSSACTELLAVQNRQLRGACPVAPARVCAATALGTHVWRGGPRRVARRAVEADLRAQRCEGTGLALACGAAGGKLDSVACQTDLLQRPRPRASRKPSVSCL